MDKLNQLAEVDRELRELQAQNNEATARQDWNRSNKLQQQIHDLMERKRELQKQGS